MPDFSTSQITSYKEEGPVVDARPEDRSNHLVIVVAKAHGLRNVLKMDKQSPYLTIRIQEQEESTPVQPRAGQTPTFNSELWFKLDSVKERTMSINVYHQKKNDSKFICSSEVDFSPALKRSTTEGYDGWFDLFYEGREAGKVYLEMSYYPKKGEVPIGTESAARMQMLKSTRLPASATNGAFKNTPKERSSIWKRTDEDIPELGSFKASRSERSIHSNSWDKNLRRTRSSSPAKESRIRVTHHDDSDNEETQPTKAAGTFFSYIENAIKLPRALNNMYYKTTGDVDAKKNSGDIDHQLDENVKLKMESPDLVQPRSGKLFNYDDDDEDDEDDGEEEQYTFDESYTSTAANDSDLYNTSDKWNIDVEPKEITPYAGNTRILSSISERHPYSVENDSDQEYTVGQTVTLDRRPNRNRRAPPRMSSKSRFSIMTEEEMRESYKGRKLPEVSPRSYRSSDSENNDDDEEDDNPPPPPPQHQISMGSLFESTTSSVAPRTFKTSNVLQKTVPSSDEFMSSFPDRQMSWYERRKAERRRVK